ncbi:MAG: MFS transporter [Streptosporangiaceae bacterium]
MTEVKAVPRDAGGVPVRQRRGALAALLMAPFMAMLDLFIVNIAAPSVQRQLHATFAAIQLVIGGYIVAFAMGLVTSGRLGDMLGRRRVFATGVVCFALTSAACSAAPTTGVLIAMRVLQGLSASLMLPQVLALIQISFPRSQHKRLLGYYGATLSCGGVCGQLAGGLLVRVDLVGLGWRTIFLVNIPLCVVALACALRALPRRDSAGSVRFDPLGVLLLSAAVAGLVCPLVLGSQDGWPSWAWAMIAGSGLLFGAFAWWEVRMPDAGSAALLPMRLFRLRGFAVGLPTAITYYCNNSGVYFVLVFFLQDGLHLLPYQASLVFLAMAVPAGMASLAAQPLVSRFGVGVIRSGAVVVVIGLLLMPLAATGGSASSAVLRLLPGLILAGAGQGIVLPCLLGLVLERVSPPDAGAAAGGIMTAGQVAVALGVAAVGAFFGDELGGQHGNAAYGSAFSASACLLAGLGAVSVILLILLTGGQRRPDPPAVQGPPPREPSAAARPG